MPAPGDDRSSCSSSFTVPLHFIGLSQPEAGANYIDLDALSSSTPDDLISLTSTGDSDAFTALYALLSRFSTLSAKHRTATLSSTLAYTSSPSSAASFKRAAFLLSGAAAAGEAAAAAPKSKTAAAKKTQNTWDKSGRDALLEATLAVLDSSTTVCQTSAWAPHDRAEFATVLLRIVLGFLEAPLAAKDRAARRALARLLAGLLGVDAAQELPATAGVIHLLNRHEHVGLAAAEVMGIMVEDGGFERFVTEVVVEITRLDPDHLARDSTSARACAAFVGDIAERAPKVALANITLLLGMLDGDSYTMRNGILHCVGRLVKGMVETPEKAETRDALFEILIDRALRDVNAFTRSKALQTWAFLAESRAIPHKIFPTIAEVAAARLEDKTAAVRKSAAQLLCTLLEFNPYEKSLALSHFQAQLEKYGGLDKEGENGEAKDREDAGEAGGSDGEDDVQDKENDAAADNAGDNDGTKLDFFRSSVGSGDEDGEKSSKEEDGVNEVNEVQVDGAAAAEEEEEAEQPPSKEDIAKAYYKQTVKFILTVEVGLKRAYKMLRSKSVSDVSEAIKLLITAVKFQLEGAASGRATRAMLGLVFARELNIKAAAIEAYQQLLAPHFNMEGGRLSVGGLAEEKESSLAIANGLIALVIGATTGEVACLGALVAELMKKEPTIVSPAVIAIMWDMFAGKIPGASEKQRSAACIYVGMFAAVLPDTLRSRVGVLEKVGLSSDCSAIVHWTCVALQKLPPGSDNERSICRHLVRIVEDGSAGVVAVEQALGALYILHPAPEEDVAAIVACMAQVALKGDSGDTAAPVSVECLAQFLHVVGHIAVKQLVRIETLVAHVRRSAGKDEEEEAGAEAEKALEFAESELTHPSSLLGQYGPMSVAIAADTKAPALLRSSAVLCMSKFMCVKAEFCKANLRLLFTLLEKAKDASVRANAITALGDMAFRFPNLVEPWSPKIYAALEDRHVRVRKNALMALTHLILNDMVKVKGQVVGLALRILDRDERIAEIASVFFFELSRKDSNAIYNLLPDTISCLSRRENLTSEDMKKVVAFLMNFVEKGKQVEKLVEKLCQRFRTSDTEKETRDIAFCIAQLNVNEKCITKLADAFKLYAPALADDDVYQNITSAIVKARKHAAVSKTGGRSAAAAGGEGGDAKKRAEELLQQIERQRKTTGDDEDGAE